MIVERINREIDRSRQSFGGVSEQRLEALESEKLSLEREMNNDLSGFNLIESFGKTIMK